MMMISPTWGYAFNAHEMSKFLRLHIDDVRAVLQISRSGHCTTQHEHDMFLSTFGVSRHTHDNKPCWSLAGVG
ncbi:unnamed protein product, partial [Pylaiella littoralis]